MTISHNCASCNGEGRYEAWHDESGTYEDVPCMACMGTGYDKEGHEVDEDEP